MPTETPPTTPKSGLDSPSPKPLDWDSILAGEGPSYATSDENGNIVEVAWPKEDDDQPAEAPKAEDLSPLKSIEVEHTVDKHGTKYSQDDFRVPVDDSIDDIGSHLADLDSFTKALQTQHLGLLKSVPTHPNEANLTTANTVDYDKVYDTNSLSENVHPSDLVNAHHDLNGSDGGGAPFEIKLLQDRLGAGNMDWVDIYRSLKNSPEHPASVIGKYLVYRYNHKDTYASGSDLDVRKLDDEFRKLHMPEKSEFYSHLTMRKVVELAAKNHLAMDGLLRFRSGLHKALRRGIGPQLRDINGEEYVALTRGLNSPIMNHEEALRSFGHGASTGFGDNMFNTWVPLKDVWYSFDLGPRFPNGNMGPEDELLVSNSGPRYEATKDDCKRIRYTSTGKKEYQKGTHLPLDLYFDDADDASLAKYAYGKSKEWLKHIDDLANLQKTVRELEARTAEARKPANDEYAATIAPFVEKEEQLRQAYQSKRAELDSELNPLVENYNALDAKFRKLRFTASPEEYQAASDERSQAYEKWQSRRREIIDGSKAAYQALETAQTERRVVDAEARQKHSLKMLEIDRKHAEALAKLPVMDAKTDSLQAKEIIAHQSLGPLTANVLRNFHAKAKGREDGQFTDAVDAIGDALTKEDSPLHTREEVLAKLSANNMTAAEYLRNPNVNAEDISTFINGAVDLNAKVSALDAPKANSKHAEMVADAAIGALGTDLIEAPRAIFEVLRSKLATPEIKDKVLGALFDTVDKYRPISDLARHATDNWKREFLGNSIPLTKIPSKYADKLADMLGTVVVQDGSRAVNTATVGYNISGEKFADLGKRLAELVFSKKSSQKDIDLLKTVISQAVTSNPNLTDLGLLNWSVTTDPTEVSTGLFYRWKNSLHDNNGVNVSKAVQQDLADALVESARKGMETGFASDIDRVHQKMNDIAFELRKKDSFDPEVIGNIFKGAYLYLESPLKEYEFESQVEAIKGYRETFRTNLKHFIQELGRNKKHGLKYLEAMWPSQVEFPEHRVLPDGQVDITPTDKVGYDPDKENPNRDVLRVLALFIVRLRKFEDNKKQHIILPLPSNLAKSAGWDAQVAEWISKQIKNKGFWYGTSLDKVHDIVEAGVINLSPTKDLLEGEAVFAVRAGSMEYLEALMAWARKRNEEPAILYFETDQEPTQDPKHPKQVYWTEPVQIKNDYVEDPDEAKLSKTEQAWKLVKYQTTFKLPKLGIDDRRDTQEATTPRQEKIATNVIASKIKQASPGLPLEQLKEVAADIPQESRGAATAGAPSAPPVSFSFHDAPSSTKLHEDMHKVFARVQERHGEKARNNLIQNMWHALPLSSRKILGMWLEGLNPSFKNQKDSSLYREEAFTYLSTYLNNPTVRSNVQGLDPKQMRFFDSAMKRAWRQLQAVSEVADHRWLGTISPWWADYKKNRDATKAYQASLAKSSFDEKLKAISYSTKRVEDWEHDMALDMVGMDAEIERSLSAAVFLSGGKEPNMDFYRVALRLYNDYDRAALYAVGMPDNERNLKALQGAKKFTEMSKNEPANIHSIQPANEEAKQTAKEVQRGVEYGLIKPLKLKGKHATGTQVVKDPETDHVWLLKPGSGKMSPGAGISDEKASMSAREAAFWHVAKVMGVEKHVPRTDLLLVNAQEWAAIALVPFDYKTLDKLNRNDPGAATRILEPFRKDGTIHRWAVLDWVAGNVDSHGQNIMSNGKDVQLIDHGSTFAGVNFDPAHDTKSFIPFYLRVWGGQDFAQKSPEERVSLMPVLDHEAEVQYSIWLASIDEKVLATEVARYGIDPKPAMQRLDKLKAGPTSRYLMETWAGIKDV